MAAQIQRSRLDKNPLRRAPRVLGPTLAAVGQQLRSHAQDRFDTRQHVQYGRGFGDTVKFGVPRQPIEVAHLVGQYDPGDPCTRRNDNFERTAFNLVCHGTREGPPCRDIVFDRRQYQRRPTPALLGSGMRGEVYVDEVSAVRLIGTSPASTIPPCPWAHPSRPRRGGCWA
jgi:hypothetical protein